MSDSRDCTITRWAASLSSVADSARYARARASPAWRPAGSRRGRCRGRQARLGPCRHQPSRSTPGDEQKDQSGRASPRKPQPRDQHRDDNSKKENGGEFHHQAGWRPGNEIAAQQIVGCRGLHFHTREDGVEWCRDAVARAKRGGADDRDGVFQDGCGGAPRARRSLIR